MPLKKFKSDLIPGIKELTLKVKKDLLTVAMAGELASKLKGRGIEFEDYRDYTTADDATRIDWRASQRSQRLLVREYKLDVNFSVFFIIDVSESMLFSSTKKLKCEYAAEVASTIFYGIITSGNSVGFGLFNDGMVKITKPQMGKKQYHLFSDEITKPKYYGGKKNFGKAIKQAMSMLDRKSLIIIISDFIEMQKEMQEYIKVLSQVHEVIGIMIRDPRDNELPNDAGHLVLEDPFSNKTMYLDAQNYAELYKTYNQKQINIMKTIFASHKSKLLILDTSEHFYNPLLSFFRQIGARWR